MARKRRASSSGEGIGKIVLVLVLCALSFLLHAWLRTQVVTSGYEVSSQRKEKNKLEAKLVDLKVKHAKLMDDNNLNRLVEELDPNKELVPVEPHQIIFLRNTEGEL